MLALLMLQGGGRSLFSTRVRCRPFTQPSYHPASTRIVLVDACSGVAVSCRGNARFQPQQGTNGLRHRRIGAG